MKIKTAKKFREEVARKRRENTPKFLMEAIAHTLNNAVVDQGIYVPAKFSILLPSGWKLEEVHNLTTKILESAGYIILSSCATKRSFCETVCFRYVLSIQKH